MLMFDRYLSNKKKYPEKTHLVPTAQTPKLSNFILIDACQVCQPIRSNKSDLRYVPGASVNAL